MTHDTEGVAMKYDTVEDGLGSRVLDGKFYILHFIIYLCES